ncbi:MAG: thioredoxin family protein [Alistipes sp.]|nr:thioredoxin family protein [Alistipes sp.]MDE6862220.1 thioredoxin family protein [Alistipes sp.]MDE7128768.1 thioredoxin family protein [Alistipes sp.]
MNVNDFNSLISQSTPTLVDFYAAWCGPCKAMASTIDKLTASMGTRATVIKIDIDNREHRDIVGRYNIVSVPTFIIFRNSEVVWRESGVMPYERLEEAIRRHEAVKSY